MRFKPTRFERIDKTTRGLGDVVAHVAKPIARALDQVLGTHLQDCRHCEERRETLNKLLPL